MVLDKISTHPFTIVHQTGQNIEDVVSQINQQSLEIILKEGFWKKTFLTQARAAANDLLNRINQAPVAFNRSFEPSDYYAKHPEKFVEWLALEMYLLRKKYTQHQILSDKCLNINDVECMGDPCYGDEEQLPLSDHYLANIRVRASLKKPKKGDKQVYVRIGSEGGFHLPVSNLFVHFTHKDCLTSIVETKTLGKPSDCYENQFQQRVEHENVYCYNVDLAEITCHFSTIPGRILENPQDCAAVIFTCESGNWSDLWNWHLDECFSSTQDSAGLHEIKMQELEIVSVEEGFGLLGQSDITKIKL